MKETFFFLLKVSTVYKFSRDETKTYHVKKADKLEKHARTKSNKPSFS